MNYKEINAELNKINKTTKEKIISFIFAFVLALLIISAPAALLINYAIYKNYLKLIVFIGALFILFTFFIIQIIYYTAISNGEIKGVWIVALGDTIIPAILIFAIVLLLFFFGVI